MLTVDVTLQLPYTGRCSLQEDVSSSHGNSGSWNVMALTCYGLWLNAQHDRHRALSLFQPQQCRNVVHLLCWLATFLTRCMFVCVSRSLLFLAGMRWSPVNALPLKPGRISRMLIVLGLILDPVRDGRSDRREVLRRGRIVVQW